MNQPQPQGPQPPPQVNPQTIQLNTLQPTHQVHNQPARQPPIAPRQTFHEPEDDLRRSNPARYLGYRVFSKWVASDQTYFIIRKFPALNVRVILSLQDEIVQLEQELNDLDEDWSRENLPGGIHHPDPETIHNGTFRYDDVIERTQLINTLSKKLKCYSKTLSRYLLCLFTSYLLYTFCPSLVYPLPIIALSFLILSFSLSATS